MDTNDHATLRSGTYDVIVVGARAAGAATAMLLARSGLRTLLLDRSPFGTDTLSTHALMRGAVLQLTRWGLLDDIVAAGTPPVRRTTFRYRDDRIVIGIKPANGVDALYAPRRTVLDPLLVRAAVSAGADVHHRTSVTDLIVRGGRVSGVHAVTSDGEAVDLSAHLVIGADGLRSTIARKVGAPYTRVGEHAAAATYGYWSDLPTDGYEWNYRANACSGVIPTNDGQACIFAIAFPERIGRGGTAVISEIVAEGAPDVATRLVQASPPSGTRTWSGHHGFIRRSHGAGWALVGDAAHFKDPSSSHGLTDALRDAELLSRAVVDGLAAKSGLDDALWDYESTRDRLSIPFFDIADRIASNLWDDAEISDLLRQLSAAMSDEVEHLTGLDLEPVA